MEPNPYTEDVEYAERRLYRAQNALDDARREVRDIKEEAESKAKLPPRHPERKEVAMRLAEAEIEVVRAKANVRRALREVEDAEDEESDHAHDFDPTPTTLFEAMVKMVHGSLALKRLQEE